MKILQFLIIALFATQNLYVKALPIFYQDITSLDSDNKKSEVNNAHKRMRKSTDHFIIKYKNGHCHAPISSIDDLYLLHAESLKKITFIPEQITFLSTMSSGQWDVYLGRVLGQQNASQVFNFYNLYQFSHFRQLIKTFPGYDQAMVSLYNRLETNSAAFDRKLNDVCKHLPIGLGVYECLHYSSGVQAIIRKQGAEFAERLSQYTIEDQIERIGLLEQARCLHQDGSIADQLALKLLDEQIVQSKRTIAGWESKNAHRLSEKPLHELRIIRMDIVGRIDAIDSRILEANNCLKNAAKKYSSLDNVHLNADKKKARIIQQQKTALEKNEIGPMIRKRNVLYVKRDCLQEQYEQVQVYQYMAQHHYTLDCQDRIDALHGNYISPHLTLTPQAQKLIKDSGFDNQLFSYAARTHLQMQSGQEVIALINKIAEQKSAYYAINAKNVLDLTGQLAHAAFNASKHSDIIQSWALTDIGNSACDYVTTQAFFVPEDPIANVAIRNAAQIVIHDITHPIETIENYCQSTVVMSELLGIGCSLDNSSMAFGVVPALPLEERIDNYMHASKKIEAVSEAMESISSDDVVTQLIVGVVEGRLLGAMFRGIGTINQIARAQLQSAAVIIGDAARGAKVLSVTEGLKKALNAIDAQIVNIEQGITKRTAEIAVSFADGYAPIRIKPDPSLLSMIAQEAPSLQIAHESLTNTVKNKFINFQTNPEFIKQIDKLHALKKSLPKCKVHDVITKAGKHIHVQNELKEIITNEITWERLAKVYDGVQLTPEQCGKQAAVWFNYQHFLGPEIKVNCMTGETRIAGFHHDYLGKIRASGILKYSDIKQHSFGFYFVEEWSYGQAKPKPSGFFPDHWPPSKVMSKIEEALNNNPVMKCDKRGNWTAVGKISEGIEIKIVFDIQNGNPTGKIITAYPIFD